MNVKSRSFILAMASSLLFISFQGAVAQESDGPSLQETLEWIKPNLVKYGKGIENHKEKTAQRDGLRAEYIVSSEVIAVSFDGCILKYDAKVGFGDEEPVKASYRLDLSKVDPISVRASQAVETANMPGNPVYEITNEVWLVKLTTTDNTAVHVFRFEDREVAKRIAKAFQNAVKLCGGKVEPF